MQLCSWQQDTMGSANYYCYRLSWAAAPASPVPSACVRDVTSMLLVTNATWSLSALLCKLCGTNMLHCLLMVIAQCSSSCGRWTSLGSLILSWTALT